MLSHRRRYAHVGTGARSDMYIAALTDTHRDIGEFVALCDPNPIRMAYYGTCGRLELDVVERSSVPPFSHQTVGSGRAVVDPSAQAESVNESEALRQIGQRVLLQRRWETATEVPVPKGSGSHGGGDTMLLDDVFRGSSDDPLGRQAGYLDGLRSILVAAGNENLRTGQPATLDTYGIDLSSAEEAAQDRSYRSC